jgi:hypothetical protein
MCLVGHAISSGKLRCSLFIVVSETKYTAYGHLCCLNDFCRPKYAFNAVTTDKAY